MTLKEAMEFDIDEETVQKVIEVMQTLVDAIVDVWNKIKEVLIPMFNNLWEAVKGILKNVNPKIYHLAYYSKKTRTRKKNQKRLFKEFERR